MAAHSWPTVGDGGEEEWKEGPQAHSASPFVAHPWVPRQVGLGWDHLLAELPSVNPISQSQSEGHPGFGGTQVTPWASPNGAHHTDLDQFTSPHAELPCKWRGKVSPGEFSPSVLPRPAMVDGGSHSWGSPREGEKERPGYHIGFERSLLLGDPSFPNDFPPSQGMERSGPGHVLEASGMFPGGCFPPGEWGSLWMEGKEASDCSIPIVRVYPDSLAILTSFCDHVEKIRKEYRAEDIHSNSGNFWNITTAFPSQLFSNTKFSVSIVTDDLARILYLTPSANYLVKDLVAEILHCFPNDQLFPEGHLLQIGGSEEFLQSDHCLGSHKIFQKDKSVIQLRLQKNKKTWGKFSRQPEDDGGRLHVSQLLEWVPGWKASRQSLLTVLRKYDVQAQGLRQSQQCVKNLTEEVKNICRVLGCVETKQITDAVNKLKLIVQRKAEPLHAPGSSTCILPELHSHLSFSVCAVYNVPELWVCSYNAFSFSCMLTYAGQMLCQVQNYRTLPAKMFFFLVNWNETITFPLEIKSLPRESMLTVKLLGTGREHDKHLLAWTSFPLFPEGTPLGGSRLFGMSLQREPPLDTIAPGVWDPSQPSPVTLQVDFPGPGWRYSRPDGTEGRLTLEEPPSHCPQLVTSLAQKQSPKLLAEEKRRYLWFYRAHCRPGSCSLPLLLGCAPGWDEATITEMQTIARRWGALQPAEALGLLTSTFPDQEIRKVAVGRLDQLPSDELLPFLPQLVQAVKFEWSLESPLVNLLLHRALQSVQMAHRLYWLLKDAINEAYFQSWYQKLLAAFQFCVGKALNDEFSKERKLVYVLGDIAEKVKSASDPRRQEVLEEEMGKLEELFQDIKTCHLPLSPALCIRGIDRQACSYFTSHATPLEISVVNANPMGKNTSVIFKSGDDLRQDMLVLQLVDLMDELWLREGLDLRMVIYRCLSTGRGQGLVQVVPDAVTLAVLHRHAGLLGPLKEKSIHSWFRQHHRCRADYEKALRNFFFSCAGWCVVTFVLGVCDRHNDNVMLTSAGHMFHVDFGKFLGHAQTCGGIKRDRAPFIFTSEMEYFITDGGKNPQRFQEFVELCCRAYNIVRKHSQLLLSLLELMLHAGFPELGGIQDLNYVYRNLRPQDTDLEATSYFTRKVRESLECFPVKLNNLIHILAQMSAVHPTKPAREPHKPPAPRTAPRIQRATVLGFSKTHPRHLYLIQVIHADQKRILIEKSFDQFSQLHSQLQKQFSSLTLPEFPHWWHLPFASSDHKRFRDLNRYLEGITGGSQDVADSDCVLRFLLSEPVQRTTEDSSLMDLCQTPSDGTPGVQLVVSHAGSKLTVLVKHMRNIVSGARGLRNMSPCPRGRVCASASEREGGNTAPALSHRPHRPPLQMMHHYLPDGSPATAHVELCLLPRSGRDRQRTTKSVPKCANPTYNEMVVYEDVTELEGRVLMLVVKSKAVFVGAVNIYLCTVPLHEEKWYPLGNSII
ncbi:LOW QUALITY PROTEIN: phosphatidylinositol 3-kinase C2 domain-containing subunit gamma [Thomomys bottae]